MNTKKYDLIVVSAGDPKLDTFICSAGFTVEAPNIDAILFCVPPRAQVKNVLYLASFYKVGTQKTVKELCRSLLHTDVSEKEMTVLILEDSFFNTLFSHSLLMVILKSFLNSKFNVVFAPFVPRSISFNRQFFWIYPKEDLKGMHMKQLFLDQNKKNFSYN